jgi:hypothetical protein
MTFSIITFTIITLSIKGLFATLSITTFSINDTWQNNTSATMLSVIMLNVAFYLMLCQVSWCPGFNHLNIVCLWTKLFFCRAPNLFQLMRQRDYDKGTIAFTWFEKFYQGQCYKKIGRNLRTFVIKRVCKSVCLWQAFLALSPGKSSRIICV